MPDTAPNDIKPAFVKNHEALRRASPALGALLDGVLAINDTDHRVFVSTDANAHLYAGRDFLLRITFSRAGDLQLQPHTDKLTYEDTHKSRAHADGFFSALIKLAMARGGFKAGWASLDRTRNVLSLRGAMPTTFADDLLKALRAAPVEVPEP